MIKCDTRFEKKKEWFPYLHAGVWQWLLPRLKMWCLLWKSIREPQWQAEPVGEKIFIITGHLPVLIFRLGFTNSRWVENNQIISCYMYFKHNPQPSSACVKKKLLSGEVGIGIRGMSQSIYISYSGIYPGNIPESKIIWFGFSNPNHIFSSIKFLSTPRTSITVYFKTQIFWQLENMPKRVEASLLEDLYGSSGLLFQRVSSKRKVYLVSCSNI